MAKPNHMTDFVRDALGAGHSRDEIAKALGKAGWSQDETDTALSAWADTPFRPPVPQPHAPVSARDFCVYTLMFGAMLFTAGYLVDLLHALIDIFLAAPDFLAAHDDFPGSAHSRIRWALAVLLVSTPLFLWLTVRDRRTLAAEPDRRRSAVRKWLTYTALLIAAVVLLGDLVATVYRLLSGDLTLQFLAKAAVVAIVAGAAFLSYGQDVQRKEGP